MVAALHTKNLAGDSPDGRYRIGVWFALASILMMFTSFSSAYIVRAAAAPDWRPIQMPRIMLLSTALLFVSSLTLEVARRKLKIAVTSSSRFWLALTTLLGIGFLVFQVVAWRQLVAQGIYVSSNPHSSFFYLLTGTHAVHLVGGLLAVLYLLVRTRKGRSTDERLVGRHAAAGAVALYWHFMDALWIYLFALLFFWR